MPNVLDWYEVLIRLLVACACAAAIGWERETANRPAGLRTNIMVGLGAAVLAVIAVEATWSGMFTSDHVGVDPYRILAAVVGGVGFLGAGAVIQGRGENVKGLTTAAGIWVSAAIGLAAGLGFYFVAGATAVFAFLVLRALRPVEPKSKDKDNE